MKKKRRSPKLSYFDWFVMAIIILAGILFFLPFASPSLQEKLDIMGHQKTVAPQDINLSQIDDPNFEDSLPAIVSSGDHFTIWSLRGGFLVTTVDTNNVVADLNAGVQVIKSWGYEVRPVSYTYSSNFDKPRGLLVKTKKKQ